MDLEEKKITFPQLFALQRGCNYFANPRVSTFPGIKPSDVLNPNGIVFSKWEGKGLFYRPFADKYYPITYPAIPANYKIQWGNNTYGISAISGPVGGVYTLVHSAISVALNGPGVTPLGTRWILSNLNPSTFNGMYEVVEIVSTTSTKIRRDDGQTSLGTYINGGVFNFSTIAKYIIGVGTFDHNKTTQPGGLIGDWTLGISNALGVLGEVTQALTDVDGSYIRLRSLADIATSRAVLYDNDYKKLGNTIGFVSCFNNGDGKYKFSSKCKFVCPSGVLEHCIVAGFWRTHSGTLGIPPVILNQLDAGLCFYAHTTNTHWRIAVSLWDIDGNTYFIEDYQTDIPITEANTLGVELSVDGRSATFSVNGIVIKHVTGIPVQPLTMINPDPNSVCISPIFAGIEIRQKKEDIAASTYFADIHIYNMSVTNFNAYHTTGLQLLKKLK